MPFYKKDVYAKNFNFKKIFLSNQTLIYYVVF